MAKMNSIDNFKTEDFPPKYSDLLSKLFYILNPFMSQVLFALNKKLSYADNFDCFETDIVFTTPLNQLVVKNDLGIGRPVRGHAILRVDNLSDPNALLTNAPFIEFENRSEQISIKNITGLATNTRYRLRVVFYP